MPFSKFGNFTHNITDLPDQPNSQYSATELKQIFDSRGEDLKAFLNSLIDILNATTDGASGADNITMTPITSVSISANTVQLVTEALVTLLKSTTAGASGAKFIGAEAITGLTGLDVQTLLAALKTLVDDHKSGTDHDIRYPRVTTADITYYVDITGNDANDGLTSGTAFRTIEKALGLVPKVINHMVTIYIPTGNYAEDVNILGFGGSGSLYLTAGTIDSGTEELFRAIVNKIHVIGCQLFIKIYGFETTSTSLPILIESSSYAYVATCKATGADYGVLFRYGSSGEVTFCEFKSNNVAISASYNSNVFLYWNLGSLNTTGISATAGSIITKSSTNPSATTPESVNGGTIVKTSLVTTDDLEDNRKLSATGDFTGTLNGIPFASHLADFTKQIPYAVSTGSANVYTVTTTPALSALVSGVAITVKIHAANTGASTLDWDSKGAVTIKKVNGSDVASGSLKLNGVYTLRYDGTSFILQDEGGEYGTAAAAQVLTGYSIGTENGLVNGSMGDRAGDTIAMSISVAGTTLKYKPTAGYRDGVNDYVIYSDADFLPGNIKYGTTIFGLTGSLPVINVKDIAIFDVAGDYLAGIDNDYIYVTSSGNYSPYMWKYNHAGTLVFSTTVSGVNSYYNGGSYFAGGAVWNYIGSSTVKLYNASGTQTSQISVYNGTANNSASGVGYNGNNLVYRTASPTVSPYTVAIVNPGGGLISTAGTYDPNQHYSVNFNGTMVSHFFADYNSGSPVMYVKAGQTTINSMPGGTNDSSKLLKSLLTFFI